MNVQEIRVIARERGVKPGRMTKLELVKMIQREEGNFACFGSAVDGQCDQLACLWRQDCFDLGKKLKVQ